MKLIYIAGPYRNASPYKIVRNIEDAWHTGLSVNMHPKAYAVIPHKNSEHMEGIQNGQYFLDATLELCGRCDALLVIPHSKWMESEGTLGEIAHMKKLNKPVFYTMEELIVWLNK